MLMAVTPTHVQVMPQDQTTSWLAGSILVDGDVSYRYLGQSEGAGPWAQNSCDGGAFTEGQAPGKRGRTALTSFPEEQAAVAVL